MSSNMQNVPQSILTPELPISTEIPGTPTEPVPSQSIPSTKESEKKSLDSSRWSHLAKKESALQRERELLKKDMEEFKNQQGEIEKYKKAWSMVNEIAELQKTDEIGAMRKAGFSDNAIMNMLAQIQNQDTPEEKAAKMARTEIEKFREEQRNLQAETDKKAAEYKKSEEERTISKFKKDIGSHIQKNAEQYEYLNFYGEAGQELVYETISQIMAEEGEMIDVEEASKLVEDFYEEQDKAMNSLKKRGVHRAVKDTAAPLVKTDPTRMVAAQMPKAARVESKQFIDNRVPTKTLTNKLSPAQTNLTQRELTHEENKMRVLEKYGPSFKR